MGVDEVHAKFIEDVKAKFREKIAAIADSATSFQSIERVFDEENLDISDIRTVTDAFRDELKKNLQQKFLTTLFEELNAEENLIGMEILKVVHRTREGTPRQPLTVEERCRPYHVRLLQEKIKFYEECLDRQKPELMTLLQKTIQYRDYVESLTKKLNTRSQQMREESNKFDQIEENLDLLSKQIDDIKQ